MDRKKRRASMASSSGTALAGPHGAAAASTALLDIYEVEWITRELERLVAASSDRGGRRGEEKSAAAEAEPAPAPAQARRRAAGAGCGGGGGGGGLLGRHAAAICGSGGEMVDAAALVARRRSKAAEVV